MNTCFILSLLTIGLIIYQLYNLITYRILLKKRIRQDKKIHKIISNYISKIDYKKEQEEISFRWFEDNYLDSLPDIKLLLNEYEIHSAYSKQQLYEGCKIIKKILISKPSYLRNDLEILKECANVGIPVYKIDKILRRKVLKLNNP